MNMQEMTKTPFKSLFLSSVFLFECFHAQLKWAPPPLELLANTDIDIQSEKHYPAATPPTLETKKGMVITKLILKLDVLLNLSTN